MDLRTLLPFAPATLRPVLKVVLDWMDATDKRLAALESRKS